MEVFSILFEFLWSLLDMSIMIGSYRFSLGGAVIFAAVVLIFIGFLHWLFSSD